MAGVNSISKTDIPVTDVYLGIKAVTEKCLAAYPNTHILLQAVLLFHKKRITHHDYG